MFLKKFIPKNSKLLIFVLFVLKDQRITKISEQSDIKFQTEFVSWFVIITLQTATLE